jgi:crotonobetainyl-CoA:carnitine CoA-transferase CaiB-like acyl-CoA transferase
LCELVELPQLAGRQWEPRLPELEQKLASRPLAEWLELFDGEDVSAGPVATLQEAALEFSSDDDFGPAPQLGEHTDAWRKKLGI